MIVVVIVGIRISWQLLQWTLRVASLWSSYWTLISNSRFEFVQRLIAAVGLHFFSASIEKEAASVVATNPDAVFAYYLYIWKVFYYCYVLLPLLQ